MYNCIRRPVRTKIPQPYGFLHCKQGTTCYSFSTVQRNEEQFVVSFAAFCKKSYFAFLNLLFAGIRVGNLLLWTRKTGRYNIYQNKPLC